MYGDLCANMSDADKAAAQKMADDILADTVDPKSPLGRWKHKKAQELKNPITLNSNAGGGG